MRRARHRGSGARPRLLRPVRRGLGLRHVRLDELLASPSGLEEVGALVRRGGVLAVPTETFYAAAADPTNGGAVGRICALKGRDGAKPLLVLFATREQLGPLGLDVAGDALDRWFAIWPAALTVVLPLVAAIPASLGARSLGLRMPAHDGLRALLERTGPLTGTSLNRSGEPPCADPDDAARVGSEAIDVLVDGGRTPGGAPSTLLDATVTPPRVLREGAFRWPPA